MVQLELAEPLKILQLELAQYWLRAIGNLQGRYPVMLPPVLSPQLSAPVFGKRLRCGKPEATRTPVTLPEVDNLVQVLWQLRDETHGVRGDDQWRREVTSQLREISMSGDPLRHASVLKNRWGKVVGGFIADASVHVLVDASGRPLSKVNSDHVPAPGERVLKPGEHKIVYLQAGYIQRKYRRQGTADTYLKERIAVARQQGASALLVLARPMSKPLMEKHGFKPVSGPVTLYGEAQAYAGYWMRLEL